MRRLSNLILPSCHTCSLPDGSSSASICIPWTKTTKQEGASIILTSRPDIFCPVAALRTTCGSTETHHFYRTPGGTWSHMFCDTFLSFVTKIWHSLSVDHVSGHSFHIGGTMILLLVGVPPEVVAATGGWTSSTFLLYWRRMEEIIPLSISNAYNSSHISKLSHIFVLPRTYLLLLWLIDQLFHCYTICILHSFRSFSVATEDSRVPLLHC